MTPFRGRVALFPLLLMSWLCSLPAKVQAQVQEQEWKQLNAQAVDLEHKARYADALPIAVQAAKVAEAELGPDDPWLTVAINNLAFVYDMLDRYAEAEPLYQRALRIHETAFGPENPLVAMDAQSLANLYFRASRYAEAEPLFERVLSIHEKAGNDSGIAADLTYLARDYVAEGKYVEAEPLYARALPLYEKQFGPVDLNVAAVLNNAAHVYDEQGKYALAEPLYLRAQNIREKALGMEHPGVATILNNLAALYQNEGRYAEAEPLYLRALQIREKALGPDTADVASVLNNLASLYDHQGRYAEAEPIYDRVLRIDEKTLGPEDPGVATDLNNLATHYFHQGQYAQAEPLFQRALRIDEKALGPEHRDLASALNNLAGLYVRQGKYNEGEALYRRALNIYEKALGAEHRDVANALNNLAGLYVRQGKYVEAEELYQRALRIREKALGPEHTDVATSLNNLAALHVDRGQYADAERLYQRALGIYEKALGPEHADVASALNNLAQLYFIQGRFAAAEPLYLRALRIDEKALGPEHTGVAVALNNLALYYDHEGEFAAAEPLFQRALRIDEKLLGPEHPGIATDLNNFALCYDHQNQYTKAAPLFARTFDNLFLQFQHNFTYMTEKERLGFLDTVADDFPVYFSFVHRFRQKDPQLVGSMYNLLLWEKGFVVGSVADMRRQVGASGDIEAINLIGQLTTKRTQIAALLNIDPPDRDLWRKHIDQLRIEANDIEKALVARSSIFAEKTKLERATWQQVRDALQTGEAAVEFARFDFYEKKWTNAAYYVALVVTPETKDQPEYIFLGEEKQLQVGAVASLQRVVQMRGLLQEPEARLPGANAYQLIWKPLEKALAGKTRIYVSPDGILNQLPLGIIPAPDGKLEMEKYDLRLLSSTRDILRSEPPRAAATALLVGDPIFDLNEKQQLAAVKKLTSPQQAPVATAELQSNERSLHQGQGFTLPRLPATGAEVNAIAELMREREWKTSVYTDELALKQVLEQADSPRVMHLATHGFFLPDQKTIPGRAGLVDQKSSGFEDPMLRSGLYFAGANRTLAGRPAVEGIDNGVLTAMEAANLNLRGTELVVLSGCNTGQGDVRNGEGVFGLRRAFEEAGAQSILMSLWSVPDIETLDLMKNFYSKWLSGMEIHEALKQAQLEVRENVKKSHDGQDLPYYWGAFVLVGR